LQGEAGRFSFHFECSEESSYFHEIGIPR